MKPRSTHGWKLALGAVLALGVSVSCASALRHPTAGDATWAKSQWPTSSLDSLRAGRRLYVEKCAGCHELYMPHDRNAADWLRIVDEMQNEQDVNLSPSEAERIYHYLATASKPRNSQAEL